VDNRIIGVANAIRSDRYPDAVAVFAAGSIVRGEGTASSDLDLVVVHASLPCAYRESFRFDGYPVEAFVHDDLTRRDGGLDRSAVRKKTTALH